MPHTEAAKVQSALAQVTFSNTPGSHEAVKDLKFEETVLNAIH